MEECNVSVNTGKMEKIDPKGNSSIEATINHESNDSLLLFDRLHHPSIRGQLLHHMEAACQAHEALGSSERRWCVGDDGEFVYDNDGAHVLEEFPYVAPTRIELAEMLDTWIFDEEQVTPVDFGDELPTVSGLHLNWINPNTGKKLTVRQWAAIEAHEKGHGIRRLARKEFRTYFNQLFQGALDIQKMEYSQTSYKRDKLFLKDGTTYAQARQQFIEYMSEPQEIVERMSQLKNYFGMRGGEPFTKAHLDYARLHYTQDIIDNHMTEFFQAVTSETEEHFLYLINNVGV